MNDCVIRQAEQRDAAQMAALDQLCFASPWSEKAFSDEIVKNHLAVYLVAEHAGSVVGYAGVWMVLDEGHITNVAVHPDHRRQGLAQELLHRMIELTGCHGIVSHTLEVRPSNAAAIALYQSFGFIEAGRRKGYYEDNGEDALIMWRKKEE